MAGVMIWLNNLDQELFKFIDESGLLDVSDVEVFKKYAKVISVRAKSF